MPTATNSYVFCADYSQMAECLFAIQARQAAGGFAGDPETLRLIAVLQADVLKLYNRTLLILGMLHGIGLQDGYLYGDFEAADFTGLNFNIGLLPGDPADNADIRQLLQGDFAEPDFSGLDFYVGYLDNRNDGYSAQFQTVLNIFSELCQRAAELATADIQVLNLAMAAVRDDFEALQAHLAAAGLDPCAAVQLEFNNSPALYLQAAGANGSGGIAAGIHLRWALAGDLAASHLPKGDYFGAGYTQNGFNRPADFVKLERAPYVNAPVFTLDFSQALPGIDYANARWSYQLNLPSAAGLLSNTVRLTFTDQPRYRQLSTRINPLAAPFDFLKSYDGLLQVTVDQKQCYAISYDFRRDGAGDGLIKLELQSASGSGGAAGTSANIRKTLTATGSEPVTGLLYGDNLVMLTLQKTAGSYLQALSFETYADFMRTRNASDWALLGDRFALLAPPADADQSEVFARLETADYPIDNLWPQYNDGTRVRAQNYRDKWQVSSPLDPSVSDAVRQYLVQSETDPRAVQQLPELTPGGGTIELSYLDVLNLMATDYHIARMLGLGHIDTGVNSGPEDRYVYRLSYTNRESADAVTPALLQYLSLPTGKTDERLPARPQMRPLTYAMPADNGLNNILFDAQGYSVREPVRVINIGRQPYGHEQPAAAFFAATGSAADFNIFEHSLPLFYGVDYRAQGTASYRKPEITTPQDDAAYFAYDDDRPETGYPETVPVPDDPASLFIHLETEPGIHEYAIYGINWFSRASARSEEVATDDTEFPLKNELLPPSAVAAQYIQKEDTLVFTSAAEQDWHSQRVARFAGQDTDFTRVTFNWVDIRDVSYADQHDFDAASVIKAKTVQAWFRPEPPMQVAGQIRQVSPGDDGPNELLVYGVAYDQIDGTAVSPVIPEADFARFTGSLLVTPEGQFDVLGISSASGGMVFRVAGLEETLTEEDAAEPGTYGTRLNYLTPAVNSRFTLTENLSDTANWQAVAETISLVDPGVSGGPHFERTVDDEGNQTLYLVGGIYGDAVVKPLTSTENDYHVPGSYSVRFDGMTLAPHPQVNLPFDAAAPDANTPGELHMAHVEWYNGLVRLPLASGGDEKKQLEVLRIHTMEPLEIFVYDAGYLDEPVAVSADDSQPVAGVNFHPGYRAYLFPEPGHSFNGQAILPGAGSNNKKTLLALQSADTGTGGTGFTSRVSMPVVLLAREIIEPVRLEAPLTYGLKVRPDATTRAAFTFDIRLNPDAAGAVRRPFGFMFYRTTDEDLLDALYAPETVTAIRASLDALSADPFYNERFLELADLVYEPAGSGNFRVFDAEPAPYGFPAPDKAGLLTSGDTSVAQKTAKYELAILGALLPLTAQPPVYSYLTEGYQTENKPAKIRDLDGNMLGPGDAGFDPFPMVRRLPPAESDGQTRYIRFTDYTLNGSARFLYFYAAAEITNQLAIGPLSPFAGAVTVLNTLPAEAPLIRSFRIGPPVVVSTAAVAVTLFLSIPAAGDAVSLVRVYRADNADKARALQTMDSYTDLEPASDPQKGLFVTDTFADLPLVPAGQLLYYRLAFVREIINEHELPEKVAGLGSAAIRLNIIDTVNPPPPQLTYLESEHKLTWPQTTNRGTYYLFTQNNKGNWQPVGGAIQADNPAQLLEYVFPEALPATDADGNPLYHRYKVRVQNASGLLNLAENELTI